MLHCGCRVGLGESTAPYHLHDSYPAPASAIHADGPLARVSVRVREHRNHVRSAAEAPERQQLATKTQQAPA